MTISPEQDRRHTLRTRLIPYPTLISRQLLGFPSQAPRLVITLALSTPVNVSAVEHHMNWSHHMNSPSRPLLTTLVCSLVVLAGCASPSVREALSPSDTPATTRPVLLTGDNARAAEHVAAQVGIDAADVRAEVLPADKRDVIAALQAEGAVVGMVGDGVNDAAALAQAGTRGLGFAMGSGADVAIEAADITLVRTDLDAAVAAVRVSRATLRIIRQNLFWAFAYNVAAIPLAVAGLLNPMIAGAAMAASSVIVVTNSLRLRRAG